MTEELARFLAAKLRELAGARADEWVRFVESLDSVAKVDLPS